MIAAGPVLAAAEHWPGKVEIKDSEHDAKELVVQRMITEKAFGNVMSIAH